MKAGLEVHQQLATGKLFCRCPCELSEEVAARFVRRLRAAGGEERAIDPAARFQAACDLLYRYESTPTSCLVEMDEEPPHALDPIALESALIVAHMVGARIVDEIQVMRKIVVDGSNTSGFQRTALIAVGGEIRVDGKAIGIESICLEEDAARKVAESPGEITYRLDRLGIPLLEVATSPDIASGSEARRVAEEIGALLRATPRVRRGIGTVREDLNVSIEGGHRVEIKGVQELRWIEAYVAAEAERQRVLLEVRDRLRAQGARPPGTEFADLGPALGAVASGPLARKGGSGGAILGVRLPGFAGCLRSPPGTDHRLGRELAERARRFGIGGLLHSDELPGYGLGPAEIDRIRAALDAGPADGFLLVADPSASRAEAALRAAVERARAAIDGIPGETRDPLPEGRTRYSRPLSGRHRMYPETDVPPIVVSPDDRRRAVEKVPERPGELEDRLARTFAVPRDLAHQLVVAGESVRFEELVRRGRAPVAVARLLTQELPLVEADAAPSGRPLPIDQLDSALRGAEEGRYAKEALVQVLAALRAGTASPEAAAADLGLSGLSDAELDRIVQEIVDRNEPLVRARKGDAFQPLMGDVMKVVRGRRDGQEIARRLRAAIDRVAAATS